MNLQLSRYGTIVAVLSNCHWPLSFSYDRTTKALGEISFRFSNHTLESNLRVTYSSMMFCGDWINSFYFNSTLFNDDFLCSRETKLIIVSFLYVKSVAIWYFNHFSCIKVKWNPMICERYWIYHQPVAFWEVWWSRNWISSNMKQFCRFVLDHCTSSFSAVFANCIWIS
jgi:hypothetical protein